AHALVACGGNEVAAWSMCQAGGVIERRHERVDYVAQAGCRVAHTVDKVEPAVGSLDWRGACAVFDFLDSVVDPGIQDSFALDDCGVHAVGEAPADAAATTRVDEPVLRPRVEQVFAVDELRVE